MANTLVPLSAQPASATQAQIYEGSAALTAVPPGYIVSPGNASVAASCPVMRFATSFAPANGANVADLFMVGGHENRANWQLVVYTVTGGALS
jgi:hypothetical protein